MLRCIVLDTPGALSLPRLGLCCTFAVEPIRFRTTTIAQLSRLAARSPEGAFEFYATLVRENLTTLESVMRWCVDQGVRAFRVGSDLWPRATHPLVAGWIERLVNDPTVLAQCARIQLAARTGGVRLSEHPDQFLVGNSLRPDVVLGTIAELEWRGRLGALLGIEVICLHVGSGAPDRESALMRWEGTLERLSPAVLSRLAFENDDRVFTPADILPASMAWGIPMVYDAHHHRVHGDALSEDDATLLAIASWGDREPYFHISSPRAGWDAGDARPHHDEIDVDDWPAIWTELADAGQPFTVDIEAKGKERALLSLRTALLSRHPMSGVTR